MKKLLLLTLLALLAFMLNAEQYNVNSNQNEVTIVSTNAQQTVLEMTLGHFNRDAVRINNQEYWSLNLKKEGFTMEAGMPQLPYISRSIIIPGMAKMAVNTLESEYIDVVMPIAPSKGNLSRSINPDTVPFTFNSFYQGTGSYPVELSRLSEPFIMRDYRGITAYFQPFVYYPATQTLRVYTRLKISVENTGNDNVNVMTTSKSSASSWFDSLYQGMFMNYGQAKYPVLDDEGRILIINNSMFNTTIQPYVDWKRQKGFTVDVVDISVAGPSAAQLKTFIQNQYDLNNDLAFVQIMGDHAQVPSLTSQGGASDPSFALTAGTDSYPDIFIGRFSAQSTTDLETQITRSIAYERDMQTGNAWLAKGMGIASNEGGGGNGDLNESDQTHIENLRTDLLSYGYTSVDQVYQAQGATTGMITNDLNDGRSMINYCGHGSDTSWGTTGYSNSNVAQLTNSNKLPFIVSVACVNGNFTNITCFAEAWMRARDTATGNPRGALVFWGSSINQDWNPPMRAQDEVTDLMIANQKNTIGGLFYNGASKMIEVYSTAGINMFKTWHIFGDASLQVRTTDPQTLTANYSPVLPLGSNTFTVQTINGARATLYANGILYGTAVADGSGTALINLTTLPTEPMDITLTITAFNKVTSINTVQVLPNQGPYIQINNQIVSDNNNNQADFGETINFDLALDNVGNAVANSISAVISSSDPYLTITDNTESFGNIDANAVSTSSNGFSIQIAGNVPDQYIAPIHVAISQNNTVTWEYDLSLTINAPAFTAGAMVIDDSSGNNNGRIDAGELLTISFPVTNTGHANASDMFFSLLINNTLNYIVTPRSFSFASVPVNEAAQVSFDMVFSSQIPSGTQVQLTLMGVSGAYSMNQNYSNYIGLVMEDFETGSLTSFPWTFFGGDWTADNTTFHGGAYSAKSADIGLSQSTQMSLSMDIPAAGNLTFWKKVSSEVNYDFLIFYINGVQQNSWSGEVNWSQETYPVNPGPNTFKWEYVKDFMSDAGSDCAWIDDINFPVTGDPAGVPIVGVNVSALDFGSHLAADFTTLPFAVSNTGTAAMIGTITGSEIFKVKQVSATDFATSVNYVIPAGGTINFEIMLNTTTIGTYNADLVVSADDPVTSIVTIPLTAVVLPVANGDQNAVIVTALKGNYPNPFNPETSIFYSVKGDAKVNVTIYNLLGQKVKTLVNGNTKSGNHSIKWNGKDDAGRNVTSGVYFYRMEAGKYTSTQKMILMK